MYKNKPYLYFTITIVLAIILTVNAYFLLFKKDRSNKIPVSQESKEEATVITQNDTLNVIQKDTPSIDLNDKKYWTAPLNIDTNYTKLEDINTNAIHEIKLKFDIDENNSIIKELKDGYIIGQMVRPLALTSLVSSDIKYSPEIKKVDKNGNLIWQKKYEYQTHLAQISNLLINKDGSFIFSIQANPYYKNNEMVNEKSLIIKCKNDGEEIWHKEFNDFYGEFAKKMLINSNNEIVIVSSGNNARSNNERDIALIKIDQDGNTIMQKSFGGSSADNIYSAEYNNMLQIIISGRSISHDGDFAINNELSYADFIACIDESFKLEWVYFLPQYENLIYAQIALTEDCIYAAGALAEGGGNPVEGFLIKLGSNGSIIFKKSKLYSNFWIKKIEILKNGDIVIGAGNQNNGIIIVFDKNGNEKNRLEDIKYSPNDIIATDDNGFIVKAIREIKCAPQPAYVSSIWYDTELSLIKYKSNYTIEWRKTYDKYKDETGLDFAAVFSTGNIVVD